MSVGTAIVTNFDIIEHLAHHGWEAGRAQALEHYPEHAAHIPAWEDTNDNDRGCWIAATKAILTGSILSPGIIPVDGRDARLAYAAYGSVTDNKDFQGNPMPAWHELPKKIRQAWCAAANAVANSRSGDGPRR